MLIITRNMLAREAVGALGDSSLIFNDFSKLSSNLLSTLELGTSA